MFDLGDTVPIVWPSVPVSPTLVTMTLTAPDGTVIGPTTVVPIAGQATYQYMPTQSGRYAVRWVATGTDPEAYSDSFDVSAADPGFIISLGDVKTQLGITSTSRDEELRMWLGATTDVVEYYVGDVVQRTWTAESHDGGGPTITLFHAPVISVTTITEYIGVQGYPLTLQPMGASTSQYGFTLDDSAGGVVTRRWSAGWPGVFQGGPGQVLVTYVAGLTVIPYSIQAAARIIVQHLWETRRGAMPMPLQGGDTTSVVPGLGYAIPDQAIALLNTRFKRTPGIG